MSRLYPQVNPEETLRPSSEPAAGPASWVSPAGAVCSRRSPVAEEGAQGGSEGAQHGRLVPAQLGAGPDQQPHRRDQQPAQRQTHGRHCPHTDTHTDLIRCQPLPDENRSTKLNQYGKHRENKKQQTR